MRSTTAPLFIEYSGVKIYNAIRAGSVAFYYYSTREQRTQEIHEEDFDVRQLPVVAGMNARTLYYTSATARPDHIVIIKAAIERGVIKTYSN